jgi:AmiR/NasT family two-component response regulator
MQDASRRHVEAQDVAHDEVETMRSELAQLRTALTRRPVIDMAKGAIMALTKCDDDDAFKQLSQVSQTHNVKLFELATALLADLRGAGTGASDVEQLVQKHWTRR